MNDLTGIAIYIVALFLMPALIAWAIVAMVRGGKKDRDKRGGGDGGGAIAGMAMDIDRLIRPSIEHVEETKDEIQKKEDDMGGE